VKNLNSLQDLLFHFWAFYIKRKQRILKSKGNMAEKANQLISGRNISYILMKNCI